MSKEEVKDYYNEILQITQKAFTENYDTTKLDNGEDEIISTEKMTITFTTSQNQKKYIYNNVSTIDLGNCEELLRWEYTLTNNETLYMRKIDTIQEGKKNSKS